MVKTSFFWADKMSPDFFHTRLVWDPELLSFNQFEPAAFPWSFYLGYQALNTPHPTDWLNTARPELFQGILPVILAYSCSLLGRAQMQQLTARNCLICVLNQPTNTPSASRRKKSKVRAVKLGPRWYRIKKLVRSGQAQGETKWPRKGPRGARRWTGSSEGWDWAKAKMTHRLRWRSQRRPGPAE